MTSRNRSLSPSKPHSARHSVLSALVACAGRAMALAAVLATPSVALAGPEGETVVRGNVSISRDGATTLIRASDRSIVNFRNFDIASHETVRFIQPNSNASVLNRIQSGSPTRIDGSLLANGRVYLVNPAGVTFGQNSIVNVGQFYAAAGNISDMDFIRGRDRFTGVAGSVINQGSITANFAALVGRQVINFGSVVATSGDVVMAAGSDVYVGRQGGQIFAKITPNSQLEAPASQNEVKVENAGTVSALKGRLWMASADVYTAAMWHSGSAKAKDVSLSATGGQGSTAVVTGSIDVSDSAGRAGSVAVEADQVRLTGASINATGAQGGQVSVLGDAIAISDTTINASGQSGGGTVTVGGEYRGGGDTRRAQTLTTDQTTAISADALLKGDGGQVILWSDLHTKFGAQISARGGTDGGDGGFVEASGKDRLTFAGGTADVRAANGSMGTFLLDPATLNIVDDSAALDFVPADLADNQVLATDADVGTNRVSWGTIVGLGATANVVLEATGLVTIGNVTGNAGGAITSPDLVTLSLTTGSLTVRSTTGNIVFTHAADTIRTEGGALSFEAGGLLSLGNLDTTGSLGTAIGAITLQSGGNISAGTLTTGGTLSLTSTAGEVTAVTNAANLAVNAATTFNVTNTGNALAVLTAGGLGTLNNTGTLGSSGAWNAGSFAVTSTGQMTLNHDVTTTTGDLGLTSTTGGITSNQTLEAGANDVTVTATGNVAVNSANGGSVSLTSSGGSVAGTTGTTNLAVNAATTFNVTNTGNALAVLTAGGLGTLNNTGTLGSSGAWNAGSFAVTSTGQMTLNHDVTTTTGDLGLTSTTGGITSNQTLEAGANDVTVTATGNVAVNSANGGSVSLTSSGGSVAGTTGTTNLAVNAATTFNVTNTGNALAVLTAGGLGTLNNTGTLGSSGAWNAGSFAVTSTGQMTLNHDVTTTTGDLGLTSTTGGITSNQTLEAGANDVTVTAPGNVGVNLANGGAVSLTSSGGNVTGSTGTTNLAVSASGDFNVANTGNALAVLTAGGQGTLNNTGTLGSSGAWNAGSFAVTSTGQMTLNHDVTTTTGDLGLTSTTGGITSNQTLEAGANDVTVTATGNVAVNSANGGSVSLTSSGGSVAGTTGTTNLAVNAATTFNVTNTGNALAVLTAGGLGTLNNTGTLGSSGAWNAGSFAVTSTGQMTLNHDVTTTTGDLGLTSTTGGITSNQTLEAGANDVTVTAPGNVGVNLANGGAVSLTSSGGNVTGSTGTTNLAVSASGDFNVANTGNALAVLTAGGQGTLNNTGTLGSSGAWNAGSFAVTSTGQMTLNHNVTTTTGDLGLTSTGGGITSNQTLEAGANDVTVTAPGNVGVNLANGGSVSLTSSGGSVTGSTGTTNLAVNAATTFNVTNTGNALAVLTAGGQGTLNNTGTLGSSGAWNAGSFAVTSTGQMTLNHNVTTTTGDLGLTSTGGGITSDQTLEAGANDVTVTAPGNVGVNLANGGAVSLTSSGGNVTGSTGTTNLAVSASGDFNVANTGNALAVLTAGGLGTLNNTGTLGSSGAWNAGSFAVTSTGQMTLNHDVTTTTGDLGLTSTTGGITSNQTLEAGANDVTVTATGNVAVNSANGGSVSLTSSGGSVAGTTGTTNLAVNAATTFNVTNTGNALAVLTAGGLGTLNNTGTLGSSGAWNAGSFAVTSTGQMTLNHDVTTTTGDLGLTSTTGGITSNQTLEAGANDVTVTAPGNVGVNLANGGAVSLTSSGGNVTGSTGTTNLAVSASGDFNVANTGNALAVLTAGGQGTLNNTGTLGSSGAWNAGSFAVTSTGQMTLNHNVTTTTGDLGLTSTGGGITSNQTLEAGANDVTVTAPGNVGVNLANGGSVSLTSSGGSVTGSTGTTNLAVNAATTFNVTNTGNALAVLTAGGQGTLNNTGTLGSSGAWNAGSFAVTSTGQMTLNHNVTTTTGDLGLTSTGGGITSDQTLEAGANDVTVTAPGNVGVNLANGGAVSLTSSGGNVTGSTGTTNLAVSASGDFNVANTGNALAVLTAGGQGTLNNTGTLGSSGAWNAGSFAVTSTGQMTLNHDVTTTTGDLGLTSTGGGITSNQTLEAGANDVTVTAPGNVGVNLANGGSVSLTSSGGSVTGSTGTTNLAVNAATTFNVTNTGNALAVLTAGGQGTLNNTGTLGSSGAWNAGSFAVTSTGQMTLNHDVTTTTGDLGLTSTTGGITSNQTLEAGANDVTVTAPGNVGVNLANGGSVSLTSSGGSVAGTTGTTNLAVNAATTFNVTNTGNALAVLTAGGQGTLNNTGTLGSSGAWNAGSFAVTSTEQMTLNHNVTTTGGSITLDSGDDSFIRVQNGVEIRSAGGDVTFADAMTVGSGVLVSSRFEENGGVRGDSTVGTIKFLGNVNANTTTEGDLTVLVPFGDTDPKHRVPLVFFARGVGADTPLRTLLLNTGNEGSADAPVPSSSGSRQSRATVGRTNRATVLVGYSELAPNGAPIPTADVGDLLLSAAELILQGRGERVVASGPLTLRSDEIWVEDVAAKGDLIFDVVTGAPSPLAVDHVTVALHDKTPSVAFGSSFVADGGGSVKVFVNDQQITAPDLGFDTRVSEQEPSVFAQTATGLSGFIGFTSTRASAYTDFENSTTDGFGPGLFSAMLGGNPIQGVAEALSGAAPREQASRRRQRGSPVDAATADRLREAGLSVKPQPSYEESAALAKAVFAFANDVPERSPWLTTYDEATFAISPTRLSQVNGEELLSNRASALGYPSTLGAEGYDAQVETRQKELSEAFLAAISDPSPDKPDWKTSAPQFGEWLSRQPNHKALLDTLTACRSFFRKCSSLGISDAELASVRRTTVYAFMRGSKVELKESDILNLIDTLPAGDLASAD